MKIHQWKYFGQLRLLDCLNSNDDHEQPTIFLFIFFFGSVAVMRAACGRSSSASPSQRFKQLSLKILLIALFPCASILFTNDQFVWLIRKSVYSVAIGSAWRYDSVRWAFTRLATQPKCRRWAFTRIQCAATMKMDRFNVDIGQWSIERDGKYATHVVTNTNAQSLTTPTRIYTMIFQCFGKWKMCFDSVLLNNMNHATACGINGLASSCNASLSVCAHVCICIQQKERKANYSVHRLAWSERTNFNSVSIWLCPDSVEFMKFVALVNKKSLIKIKYKILMK